MKARELIEGQMVDLHPIALRWGTPGDVLATETEYAVVDSVAPADPVDGVEAVVLFTDLGNFKIPAEMEVRTF